MKLEGNAIKYGDNIDTDVIIPARYLNSSDPEELAAHCMEDLDKTFVSRVKPGDIMVAGSNFGCGSSREHALVIKTSGIGAVMPKALRGSSSEMRLISVSQSSSAIQILTRETEWRSTLIGARSETSQRTQALISPRSHPSSKILFLKAVL